jgi:hypothetical protein
MKSKNFIAVIYLLALMPIVFSIVNSINSMVEWKIYCSIISLVLWTGLGSVFFYTNFIVTQEKK